MEKATSLGDVAFLLGAMFVYLDGHPDPTVLFRDAIIALELPFSPFDGHGSF